MTPLCSAVLNESPSLFDEVLEQADKMALEADREPLDAGEVNDHTAVANISGAEMVV